MFGLAEVSGVLAESECCAMAERSLSSAGSRKELMIMIMAVVYVATGKLL